MGYGVVPAETVTQNRDHMLTEQGIIIQDKIFHGIDPVPGGLNHCTRFSNA